MNSTALSPNEAETLLGVYKRDVAVGWPWREWVERACRDGHTGIGFSWVLLPHKIRSGSPLIWREECALYQQALTEHARKEFGLEIGMHEDGDHMELRRPVAERARVAA